MSSFTKVVGEINEKMTTTQVITLGFLFAIFAGAFLLMMPFSSATGEMTPFLDSLFTATTSVCVTGLVVVTTASHWSVIGKIIILCLIQIGGLGIIALSTAVLLVFGRRVSLKGRLLIQSAFNLNTLRGLVKFTKNIIYGTFFVESLGAIGYSFVFVPKYGLAKGLFYSVFHAVSAFCNAGLDILGQNSLMDYVDHPWINFVTICLIVLGGLGFVVWWDFLDKIKMLKKGKITAGQLLRRLSLHSKIVLSMTLFLILFGAVAVFGLEYTNADTIGPLSFGGKVMASLFQSVTTRTAGFLSISQKGLREATAILTIAYMMIGGSPVGTAGGVKTTTIAVLIFETFATIRGAEEVNVFHRRIAGSILKKASAVVVVFIFFFLSATLLLYQTNGGSFMDVAFETASAIGTAGLSRDYTFSLNAIGKLIIIVCMYLGRIGPISLAISLSFNKKRGLIQYPEENVTIG
ncbi:MAG: potassium transporter KtrB [Lachnospiraceae bacterium]|nr:potassium transporter KtrB [Lachnospiraceae bacterium]